MTRIFATLLAIGTTAILALTVFAYPAADDFCLLYEVQTHGFIAPQIEWYRTWTGRYSSSAIASALALAGPHAFRWGLLSLGMLWFAAIYLLLWALAGGRFGPRVLLLGSATAFVLYVAYSPSPTEGFYWAAGALTYLSGNVLLLLIAALNLAITRVAFQRHLPRVLKITAYLANVLLGVTLAGTNETAAIVALIGLSAGAGFAWRFSQAAVPYWIAGFLAVASGFVVVAAAPGNEFRMLAFPNARQFVPALVLTGTHAGTFVIRQFTNVAVWICAALIWVPIWRAVPDIVREWIITRGGWLWLLVLWLAAIVACFFPTFYAVGYAPPARVLNVAFLVFLLGVFPVTVSLVERFTRGRHFFTAAQQARPFLLFILIVVMAKAPQIRNIYDDVLVANQFRKEMLAREELIHDSKVRGALNVEVPALATKTYQLYFQDIEGDSKDWKNRCMARAFGVSTIRIIDLQ